MHMRRLALLAVLGLLSACAQTSAQSQPPQVAASCAAPLKPALALNLYFGRDKPGGMVSEAEWATFVAQEVTPRFPDGLSVINVAGQSRGASGSVERERTKLLIIVVFDAPAHQPKVVAIIDAYNRRFAQNSVFRTEHAVCAGL
ncbi:MAG: DUF3574 domain-containing protein [Reyranella sp.]|nr:MAG: DUF3574 domain-containing protein [Reyranella sp.]